MASLHRIRRQRWQVRAGDHGEAMRWRRVLREEGYQPLMVTMAAVFDAMELPQQTLHVPRLQVHLKVSSLDELHQQLPQALADALGDELRQLALTKDQSPIRGVGPDDQSRDVVRHYLLTGQLRWSEAYGDRQQQQQKLTLPPILWRQALLDQLSSVPDESSQLLMIWRWLQRMPDVERLAEIGVVLSTFEVLSTARPSLQQLLNGLPKHSETTPFQLLQWQSLFVLRVWQTQRQQRPLPASLFAVDEHVSGEDTSTRANVSVPSTTLQERLQEWLQQPYPVPPAAPRRSLGNRNGTSPSENRRDMPAHDMAAPFHELLAIAAASTPVLPLASRASESPAVTVLHAGLVLLHPFFPQLFRQCELWQSGETSLSMWQLPRAAALLHFLATGAEDIAEHECGAIKLLLGLAVEAPLPVAAGLLTERDRKEAEQMLLAVIEHWSALKQTSVNGLRLSFLQRPGLLRAEADGWRLHIEREAFDVLLDFLPWGIGVIKQPWMTDAIHTAW